MSNKLPWVLRASIYQFSTVDDISAIYYVSQQQRRDIVRFLTETTSLDCDQQCSQKSLEGFQLVRKHCSSLRRFNVSDRIEFETFNQFSGSIVAWLADVIRKNASTLRDVRAVCLWMKEPFDALCTCQKLEQLSLDFDIGHSHESAFKKRFAQEMVRIDHMMCFDEFMLCFDDLGSSVDSQNISKFTDSMVSVVQGGYIYSVQESCLGSGFPMEISGHGNERSSRH